MKLRIKTIGGYKSEAITAAAAEKFCNSIPLGRVKSLTMSCRPTSATTAHGLHSEWYAHILYIEP